MLAAYYHILANVANNGTAYEYNLANLVTGLYNEADGTCLSYYLYEYSLDGNQTVKYEIVSDETVVYIYDKTGRLKSEEYFTGNVSDGKITYLYDSNGNRTAMVDTRSGSAVATAYTYDANNRLLTSTTGGVTTTYGYDGNGNQITVTKGSDTEEYFYNEINQLIAVENDSGLISYDYLANGLRHSKSIDNVSTTHIWDGALMTAEIDYANNTTYYINGIGLLWGDDGSGVTVYMRNAHGDVVHLVDVDGTLIKTYNYDAFGVERDIDPNDVNPFRYCGEYFDVETGTIYLRARYYDPVTGRFTSEDPIKDGLNWYTYCNGNPIRYIDPSGLVVTVWDKNVLSKTDLEKIKTNDAAWVAANKKGDTKAMNAAAASSKAIRSKYLVDGEKLLSNGYVEATFNQAFIATGLDGDIKIKTSITFTRTYTESGMLLRLDEVSGRVTSLSRGLQIIKVSGMYGVEGSPTQFTVNGNFNYTVNSNNIRDLGSFPMGVVVGLYVRYEYRRGTSNTVYSLEIINQVHTTEYTDNGRWVTNIDSNDIIEEIFADYITRGSNR